MLNQSMPLKLILSLNSFKIMNSDWLTKFLRIRNFAHEERLHFDSPKKASIIIGSPEKKKIYEVGSRRFPEKFEKSTFQGPKYHTYFKL